MKTRLEKTLLAACICLALYSVVITVMTGVVVPNKRKFDKMQSSILLGITNIGDGTYYYHHFYQPYVLNMRYENDAGISQVFTLLHKEIEHKFENEIFYGYFKEGFAIVYPESNLCKVLRVSIDKSEREVGHFYEYESLEDGRYIIRRSDDIESDKKKLIVYVDAFEEFTPYEQKILNSLVEKHDKKKGIWKDI